MQTYFFNTRYYLSDLQLHFTILSCTAFQTKSKSVLFPQGLSDTEEFVIQKTLSSLQKMVFFGFIYKSVLLEFVADISPLLAHPVSGVWS